MNPQLLPYYEQELDYLREMGKEFAKQHPKIASRLTLDTEVADPYVERLLEGVSFLAARIRLKLDAEFPRFTRHLLEMVYPHYLSPTPAMVIAELMPTLTEGGLASGFPVPRGTALRSQIPHGEETVCQFRTGHDVVLWPIEITEARYSPLAPDLPLLEPGVARSSATRPASPPPLDEPVRGVLRLKLRSTASLTFSQIALDRLTLFLSGSDEVAQKLYELIFASGLGVLVVPPARPLPWHVWLGREAIHPVGFAPEQALLPYSSRSFDGYRLLQEYFAFPERFRFVELVGLQKALRRHAGDEIEVAIPLARADATLASLVTKADFALHCTPALNVFPSRADRIHVSGRLAEHQVVIDRTRPMDFEAYALQSVTGYSAGAEGEHVFRPFYATFDADRARSPHGYFTVRREPRVPSESQRRNGARTGYIGSEVFLSLVDARQAPYPADLRQLGVEVLVTNRDLPLLMPKGSDRDFSVAISAPIEGIRCRRGPSAPRSAVVEGEIPWRLVSHLALNYLTATDSDPEQGAAALRELLQLYTRGGQGDSAASVADRQIGGVRRISVVPRTRRFPAPGPIVFARGLEVRLAVDEAAFSGASAFLLGAVLEHFFARIASMNTFTELVLQSETRGEIKRWPPRIATRQLV